ncbi:MAG: HlyD family efflux transporter periplasmic adaptor subunit [Acidobacteria bacterium]|nr:HlyD family efflux transporter periplasmic adaptor subunit [Acidobacteriota bacterium]MBI3422709.1 HlyD family efflux transporter periplasmic adaptor subunit [Acidobacteriota bacterium]
MDVPRAKSVARNRKIKQAVYIVLALAAIVGVTLGVSRLKPAAPTVERATVIIDTVKQAEFLRNVRGLGTLVPEDIVWITSTTKGRIDKRLIQPGSEVRPDTILFEMSDPELQQQLLDAEQLLHSAEAEYKNREVDLNAQLLNQRAQAATVQSDWSQARLTAEANEQLSKDGLVSEIILKQSRTRAEELATRYDIEQKRIAMNTEALKTQLAVQQATLEQRRALVDLRRRQVADLRVRAGMHGILQLWAVEVGQQVTPGTNLARVSDPSRLKAQVRVAETQAKDIVPGLRAEIDTRNGIITGRVTRLDPQAQNGTVTVDVALEGALPKGARPDMSVDGTIELERLANLVQIQRPAFGQPNSTVTLFKLEADGIHASATKVTLGRDSVTSIEVRDGLRVGDKVIVSDTSQWSDKGDRIKLN